MNRLNYSDKITKILIVFIFAVAFVVLGTSPANVFYLIVFLCLVEIVSYFLVYHVRKNFPWFITPKDYLPVIYKERLKEFIKHGYDPELGWVRKPLTWKEEIGKDGKTLYTINAAGARSNPNHENLERVISCYGDSFTFCRQVNDNQTFEWFLSELTNTNVVNFGVGNYGLDQSLLRLFREYPSNKTKVVMIGVVPSTIVRILCVWKHYNEFGNVLGFKPRFMLSDGSVKLIKNVIDNQEKLENYKNYLPDINKYDEFYNCKFKKEMLSFPYSFSILSNPLRNITIIFMILCGKFFYKEKRIQTFPPAMNVIMANNLKLRVSLFRKKQDEVKLLQQLVSLFVEYAEENNFTPVFLWMPQKDDILYIKKKKDVFYEHFLSQVRKKIITIDLTEILLNCDKLDDLYSDDSKYGGHFNKNGNSIIADFVYSSLIANGVKLMKGGGK